MTEWTTLSDVLPDSPILASWGNAVRDNISATAEGADNAPGIGPTAPSPYMAEHPLTAGNEVMFRVASVAAVGDGLEAGVEYVFTFHPAVDPSLNNGIIISPTGFIRVAFNLRSLNVIDVLGRIYVNGILVITETTRSQVDVAFINDISVNAGDIVQVAVFGVDPGNTATMTNIEIRTSGRKIIPLLIQGVAAIQGAQYG